MVVPVSVQETTAAFSLEYSLLKDQVCNLTQVISAVWEYLQMRLFVVLL